MNTPGHASSAQATGAISSSSLTCCSLCSWLPSCSQYSGHSPLAALHSWNSPVDGSRGVSTRSELPSAKCTRCQSLCTVTFIGRSVPFTTRSDALGNRLLSSSCSWLSEMPPLTVAAAASAGELLSSLPEGEQKPFSPSSLTHAMPLGHGSAPSVLLHGARHTLR